MSTLLAIDIDIIPFPVSSFVMLRYLSVEIRSDKKKSRPTNGKKNQIHYHLSNEATSISIVPMQNK